MGRKVYTNAFSGGEISPLMFGHIEDEGYRTGFARGRNMLVLPTGAAQKRPQFEFVRACKPGATVARLFPFVYGDGDAYAMEWGTNHVRFHAEGTTLKYATPRPVASVNLTTDVVTTVDPHTFAVNDEVRITHKGTSIPGSLSFTATYKIESVPSATTFTLKDLSNVHVNLTTNDTIDETSFWLQSELPREYVSSKSVAITVPAADTLSVVGHSLVAGDAVHFTGLQVFTVVAPDICTTAAAHNIPTDTPVTLSTTGVLPTGLSLTTTYYVNPLTATTFELRFSPGGALVASFTVSGSGVHSANIQAAVITSTPSLGVGVVAYVSINNPNTVTLHTTRAGALAGTGVINITGVSGVIGSSQTCHFAYYQGDIVWGGALTLPSGTSSRAFRAIDDISTSTPVDVPLNTNWSQMPADGVYELYTTLGAAALAELNYDQSLDVWTLCKPQSAAFTLSRETASAPSGSSATLDYTKFVFRRVDPEPGPPAPTLSQGTLTYGEYYNCEVDGATTPSLFEAAGNRGHALIVGDILYGESSVGSNAAVTGVAGTPGFFLVSTINTTAPNDFQIRRIDGGDDISESTGTLRSIAFRRVGSSSKTTESYVVTALRDGDESLSSNVLTVINNLEVPGSSNVLNWTAVTGAQRYRLYKLIDSAYGLVIETDLLTATDDNIGPDLSVQPPVFDDTLDTEYPRAVANFQQRAWFGGTDANPRTVWGSKTGTVSTMSYHVPNLVDTDRIEVKVGARERTLVKHIVSSSQLWVMTSSAEIKLTGQNTDVLSPVIGIDARALSQIGCTGVRPIVANSNILFVGAKNGHVYEMPSQTLQIVDPPDLSIRGAHMFDGFTLSQSAQQEAPVPVEWYTRSDGALLGMTYMPEQNIRGWHVHTAAGTNASIQSVCVIPDSDGQRLYAVISRTINGSTKLYVERMGRIAQPTTLTACRYLDSCVTYTGTATTTIPVAHLVGETVYAVADGALKGPFVVGAGGTITLGTAASTVHVGLLYSATLRTLPPIMMIYGYGKGIQANVAEVSLRVDASCGFNVAVYSDDGITRRPWAANGISNLALTTRDIPVPVEGSYGRNSQIDISQTSPFPLTIVSMTLDVTTGGP